MKCVVINSKFCVAKLTGVQRVAWELRERLSSKLKTRGIKVIYLQPPSWIADSVFRAVLCTLWEQFFLPVVAGQSFVVNLCNSAPILSFKRQFVLVHDAAVFDMPGNYSKGYRVFSKLIMYSCLWRRDFLGTVSNFSRLRISHVLNIEPDRVKVFLNGRTYFDDQIIDDVVLDRLGVRSRPYILAVGSLQPGKNFSNLLRAMQTVPQNFILVIVGGNDSDVFNSGVKLESDRYVHAGYVTDAQLHALYVHAQAFVQASTYEGFGLPALEAMTLGVPVVCSNAASLPEVCGDAAIYFDPSDPSDMSHAISKVLTDSNLKQLMKSKGLIRSELFDWNKTAELMADYICESID